MTIETFMMVLLIVSTLTGLFTEALKKCFDECKRKYYSNLLAGATAVVLSLAIGIAYIVLEGLAWSDKMAVYLIALVFLSWLSAMVGYDKVMQAISQIKSK